MRTPLLIVLTIAVIATGVTGCQRALAPDDRTKKFVLEIPKGHRLKLKLKPGQSEEEGVKAFEELLKHVGAEGTSVTLRYKSPSGEYKVDEGPVSDGFSPVPSPSPEPDGSIHNTQKITAKNEKDIKAVLDSLEASFTPP